MEPVWTPNTWSDFLCVVGEELTLGARDVYIWLPVLEQTRSNSYICQVERSWNENSNWANIFLFTRLNSTCLIPLKHWFAKSLAMLYRDKHHPLVIQCKDPRVELADKTSAFYFSKWLNHLVDELPFTPIPDFRFINSVHFQGCPKETPCRWKQRRHWVQTADWKGSRLRHYKYSSSVFAAEVK